ncbi:hypothetical protein AB0P12_28690 [Streptomyces subrutilus]|uniref:hypothetical protein n=1 Tax=Streptomyces subrutilus TaxID=36818 RepID=UPI0033CF76E7
MGGEEELDWAAMLRFDQERGAIEGRRHDATAAGLRGDAAARSRYLEEVVQLEMLPRLWEFGVRLTVEEYRDAVRVRSWMIHEQRMAADRASRRPWPPGEHPDRHIRYYWSRDGRLLYVTTARDDGRFVANHRFLTPEWAERLRREIPLLADLVTRYEANQEAGRGHEGISAPFDVPLLGDAVPDPLRLWRERIEGELRRRAAEQAAPRDPEGGPRPRPDADPPGR